MYEDETSQPPEGASQPSSSTAERLSGMMALARRREAEANAALSRAAEAEAETAAMRSELDEVKRMLASLPPAPMDVNRPLRQPASRPDAIEDARTATWESFGIPTPQKR
jgi:hypothetical protein